MITYDGINISAEKILLDYKIEGVVFSICNKSNKYWIGTSKTLLSFILTDKFKISQIVAYSDPLLIYNKSKTAIRCVKFDIKQNCIWIGTEMNGLVKAVLDANDNVSKFTSINKMYEDVELSKYIY